MVENVSKRLGILSNILSEKMYKEVHIFICIFDNINFTAPSFSDTKVTQYFNGLFRFFSCENEIFTYYQIFIAQFFQYSFISHFTKPCFPIHTYRTFSFLSMPLISLYRSGNKLTVRYGWICVDRK